MICLDTSFLIDLLRNDKSALKKANEIKNYVLATTQINVFEILFGIYRLRKINNEKYGKSAQMLFDRLDIFPLDLASSQKAAQIAGELVRKGAEIEQNDCITAAIAICNGCDTIITKDKGHFKRIKGIAVEEY